MKRPATLCAVILLTSSLTSCGGDEKKKEVSAIEFGAGKIHAYWEFNHTKFIEFSPFSAPEKTCVAIQYVGSVAINSCWDNGESRAN